jgi:hypothetical protein
MKINIISNHRPKTGLRQDCQIIAGLLLSKEVEVKFVQYVQPHCDEADINIFVETVNPSLFAYASKNIWIPNHECTCRTWIPYMHMMNEIWVKTREAESIFKKLTPTNVRYIGWTSINKETPKSKNYFKAIVPLGKNQNREIIVLFDAYKRIQRSDRTLYSRLPVLNVVCHTPLEVPEEIKDSVVLHALLSDSDYNALLTECGVCICLSKAEGFGHVVNEAMASGCNLILSNIPEFRELASGLALFCNSREVLPSEEHLGHMISTDVMSLCKILEEYVDTSIDERRALREKIRTRYETRHREFIATFQNLSQSFVVEPSVMPKEEELPCVSIVCITNNRRVFMPVLKYSYMIQSYPEDKMELIIVDDGDDSIEDTLIGVPNVVYVRLPEKKTIGEKRNIGVSKAMYDVITFMDDDDVYPNNSVLHRTAMMLKTPSKECAFCTTIPCYDISKYSSFMNVPPFNLQMSERVSEATLIFTKKFWEERKFSEVQIAEGDSFIRGREHMCRELSPQEVIVSLVHPLNTSSRKIPDIKEPNGCHYGFNEKLFAMVSEIGESLKLAV